MHRHISTPVNGISPMSGNSTQPAAFSRELRRKPSSLFFGSMSFSRKYVVYKSTVSRMTLAEIIKKFTGKRIRYPTATSKLRSLRIFTASCEI